MPLKKDNTGKRWVEMEFLAPGTPEQVWEAMATGPGYAAWFTKAEIEERVGGALRFHFGADLSTSGEVTEWQPPRKFSFVENEWMEGAPPVATEITITSRSGDECHVRMVHSLFADSDDWDKELEGFEGGWPGFFAVLRLYLRHFAGQPAAAFQVMSSTEGTALEIWKRLLGLLNLAGVNMGETRILAATPEALTCEIEEIVQTAKVRSILAKVTAPRSGMLLAGTYQGAEGIHACASLFLYGDEAQATAASAEPLWRQWLEENFPPRPGTEGQFPGC